MKNYEIHKPSERQLISVVWGEEQAPIPALVTAVNQQGFKALIMPPLAEAPLGPFNFLFSDVATMVSAS